MMFLKLYLQPFQRPQHNSRGILRWRQFAVLTNGSTGVASDSMHHCLSLLCVVINV